MVSVLQQQMSSRLKGAEVSSVMIIDPRAIVDPAAGLAYSNSSLNGKVISQSSIQKKVICAYLCSLRAV